MSDKTLVIVESPAKAKTINKYLGSKYIVKASVGHIKDLEKHKLGVDVENEFKPKYVTVRGKAPLIKELKQFAAKSKDVLVATDPDREGEAIAWHIAEELRKDNPQIKRVLFNEITKAGVKKGLAETRDINIDLFMSQQARRVMDRLIGYQVSPFLSRAMLSKTTQSLSAGRVQSVALRLICEREEEIRNFTPISYWSINADFLDEKKETLKTRLVAFNKKNIRNPEGSAKSNVPEEQQQIDKYLNGLHYIKSEEQAKELLKEIEKHDYNIKEINKKNVKRNPQAPFTTSSLQQEASKRLGFSNKKTMTIAQKLYEGVNLGSEGDVGLITYMRTDSVRISPEAEAAAKVHIEKNYGKDFVPEYTPKYQSKSSNVQDAHEAVRPSVVDYTPNFVRTHLDRDEFRLYELIYNRFLASQMTPAVLAQTTINIEGGDFVFRASGSIIVFKGFLAVYEDIKEENQNGNGESNSGVLPEYLREDMPMKLHKADKQGSQTKPKPRYTEASLVKELDEKGIGRPSTYASIVSTLLDRNYVTLERKAFEPTELGIDVNGILIKNFPELFNIDFTAEMENDLDIVADGNMAYSKVLNAFYGPFKNALEKAETSDSIEKIVCDKCGGEMVIKVSRRGRFLGCANYPECTNTKPLPKNGNEKKEEPKIAEGVHCDLCGKEMLIRDSKFGKFYGCIDYPNCKGIKQITLDIKCPKCNEGLLSEKYSAKTRKSFWGCSNYPKCDYITNYKPVKKSCPSCGHYYLEVRFRKADGDWEKYLSCPSCKEKFDYNDE